MSWRLVVDPGVEPAGDVRERLEEARSAAPGAVVLAAKVLLPGGELDLASAPMPRILDKEAAIAAARLGLLAVRAVRPGALLVPPGSPLAGAPPRAVLAVSAALLATGEGHLVPQAVATRVAGGAPEPLRARVSLLRAAHWTREERLLQLFALAGGGRR